MCVVFNTKQYQTVIAINGATTLCSFGKPGTTQSFSYHNNGNILSNSQVGEYDYLSDKQHAVFQIGTVGGDTSVVAMHTYIYQFSGMDTGILNVQQRIYGIENARGRQCYENNFSISASNFL